MKIIFPCTVNPFFDSSAAGNRYESLLNGLIENGVQVHIFVLGGYNTWQEYIDSGKKSVKSNLKVSYPLFTFQNNIWLRRINRFILSPLTDFLLLRILKKEYDNTYDFIWITGNLVLRKSILANLDLISKKSRTFIELSEFQNINTHKIKKANLKKEKDYTEITLKLLKHIDCFAIMTKILIDYYKDLAQNSNAKFIHLPMTVDLERFNISLPVSLGFEQPYIAFVGVMNDTKDGVNILIEAFAKIHLQFPQYKVYLIGGWNYDTPHHDRLIKEYGLQDKVFWKGEYPKKTIPAIIKNAALLALPRPDSKQAQGGFPTKLGEYLATGNPVCATTVGELPQYLIDKESIYFAKPGSIDSFADAMTKALSNPKEAQLIGKKGREVAEKYFNKDIQSKLLYNFLKQL